MKRGRCAPGGTAPFLSFFLPSLSVSLCPLFRPLLLPSVLCVSAVIPYSPYTPAATGVTSTLLRSAEASSGLSR